MSSQAATHSQMSPQTQPGYRSALFARYGESILIYIGFALFAVVIGLPFYFIFVSSITPSTELFNVPPTYWPSLPTLDNYARMVESIPFLTYFRNSVIFG
ncbi:MAG: hypothetical protein KC547_17705, partial [Anaerolineae bacterium]|nr:hypothetical protein [Anaerolineae bacterium]